MNVFTQTLTSGTVFTIEPTATFGDVFIAAAVFGLVAVMSLWFIYEVIYR